MKSSITTLIILLAVLLTMITTNELHAGYSGDMLFWEDFENLGATKWTEKTKNDSSWIIVKEGDNYVYHQQFTTIEGADPYVNEWSIYTANEYKNYTVTFKVKTAESLVINPAAELGVFFHYQDEDNYYYVNFSAEADSSVLIKRVAGVNHVLTRCSSPLIEDNDWFAVTIKSIDGKIVVMAHDITIFQFYDTTFTYGYIGLGVKDDAAYFDDIVMCRRIEVDAEYYQDFNENALTGWKALNKERWSTNFKDYTSYSLFLHTNENNYWDRSRLGEIMTINKIEAKNFKFECDLKTVEYGRETADLAMVFCYYDDVNYYAAIFHRQAGMTRILRVKNGNSSILAEYSGTTLEDYEWHEATVIAQDNQYQVFYDSQLIMSVFDDQLVVGKLGVGSLNNTGKFDNISIWGNEIVQEKITLTSPNGSEVLAAGTTHRINWLSEFISNNVALEYSLNNGSTWTPITSSVFNKFEFDWVIPEENSTKCRVRVRDVDEHPIDQSDRIFTIVPAGNITITSPVGGDVFKADSMIDIEWTSNNTSGLVDIAYSSDNGSTWNPIVGDAIDDGSYKWIAPAINSSTCLIRITDVDGFPRAESAAFAIYEPTEPVLLQPVAEVIEIGSGKDIRIYIQVGKDDNPVQDLFGASYKLTYTPTEHLSIIEPYSANVIVGDFLGTDLIHYSSVNVDSGTVSVGTSRKYGNGGVSGKGILLEVQFHVSENIPEGDTLTFTLDEISANTEAGTPILLGTQALHIVINEGIPVWPGDTNNDGIVNQKDILPIGQYWGLKGPSRDIVAINWQEYKCPEVWTPAAATYADCNGNGVVDHPDILAIGLNWDKKHQVSMFKRAGASADKGAMSSMQLNCQGEGTNENPYYVDIYVSDVEDMLGVSFNLLAAENGQYVNFESVQYTEFFGTDLISYEDIDNKKPLVSVGASRKATDGGIDGTGSICRVFFTLKENTPMMESITFELADVTSNDSLGNAIDLTPETTTMITGVSAQASMPTEFALQQNYPNPFNPGTVIEYSVPSETHITIDIYNSLGQKVRSLVNEHAAPAHYTVKWNGTNDSGHVVSPGIYLARLKNSENESQLIKMVFAK